MNDQQRIEMAADNCEVLRARLAKYEDAEGRALQRGGEVLSDEELWSIRNQVAINEVLRDDDSVKICVKHGRAIEQAVLSRLNSSPVSAGDDAEQAAFEDWLVRVCPSGDADSVHAQWLESSDYEDFCDQAYDIEAERLTAEALGTGAGINPNATSIDDIFLTESAGGVDERE